MATSLSAYLMVPLGKEEMIETHPDLPNPETPETLLLC